MLERLIELLDEIAEVDAATDLLRSDMAAERDKIVPDDVAMELEALEAEFAGPIEAGKKKAGALAKQARLLAAQHGETVKAGRREARVFTKVSWNDDGLRRLLGHWATEGVLTPDQLAFAMQQRNEKVVAQIRVVK